MSRYIIVRVLGLIPTLLVLLFFVVLFVRLLPGNAADILLQEQANASDLDRQTIEDRMGIGQPLPQEYVEYTGGVLRGDLGKSLWTQEPVIDVIKRRISVTLELSFMALTFAIVLGTFIGVISAIRQNTPLDYLLRGISIAGLSVPNFALATLVIVLPSLWFDWAPPLVYTPPSENLWNHISQFFVPAAVLGIFLSATIMRVTRTAMLDVMRSDYIRTAEAKGLRERVIVWRHALRNAMISVVSLIGVQVAFLFSGAVVVENIFALPGIGRTLVTAVGQRDYPMIQGITVVTGLLVMTVNLLVDLSYGWLDPRTRAG